MPKLCSTWIEKEYVQQVKKWLAPPMEKDLERVQRTDLAKSWKLFTRK